MASRHFLRQMATVRRPLITSSQVCNVRAVPSQISSVRELSGISGYFRDLKEKFAGMWKIKHEIQEEDLTQIQKNLRAEEFARLYKKWDDVYKDLKQYDGMDKISEEIVRNIDVNFKSLGKFFSKCPDEVTDQCQDFEEFIQIVDNSCNALRRRIEERKSQNEVADKEIEVENWTQIHKNPREEELARVYKKWDDVYNDSKQYYGMDKEFEERTRIYDFNIKSLGRVSSKCPDEVTDQVFEEFIQLADDSCNMLRRRIEEMKSQNEAADEEIQVEKSTQIHKKPREEELARLYKKWDDVYKDSKQYCEMDKELEEINLNVDFKIKSLGRKFSKCPNEATDQDIEEFIRLADNWCNALRRRIEEMKSQNEVADKEIQCEKSTLIHKNQREEELARVYKKWDDVYKDSKQYYGMDKILEEIVRDVDANFESLGRRFSKCPDKVTDQDFEEFIRLVDNCCYKLRRKIEERKSQNEVADEEIQEEKSTQIHKNPREEEFARVHKKWDDVYKDSKQYIKEMQENLRITDVNFKSLGKRLRNCPDEVTDQVFEEFIRHADNCCDQMRRAMEESKRK